MKIHIVNILAGLLFPLFVMAQPDTLNQLDANGQKHGHWIKKDESGIQIYEGEFNHGIPVGKFIYLYSNGKTKAIVTHAGDGIYSSTTIYYPGGYIMATGAYNKNVKDGMWIYYNEIGKKVSEEYYVNMQKDGKWKTFYSSGMVAEEFTWKNDKRNGPWFQYFTDGTIKLSAHYLNDLKEGPFTLYYLDHQVELSGNYRMGKREGEWIHYLEDGRIQKQQLFSNGILVSEVIYVEIPDEDEGEGE